MQQEGIVHAKVKVEGYPGRLFDRDIVFQSGRILRTTTWYSKGKKLSEWLLVDTVNNTLHFDEYFESGAKKSSSVVQDGLLTDQNTWYENGTPELVFTRTPDSIDNGKRYYSNGAIKEEFRYSHDRRDGVWNQWDSLGHQTRNEFYVNGLLQKKARMSDVNSNPEKN